MAVNKNASKNAIKLLDYLRTIEGKAVLTGQHSQTYSLEELKRVKENTGEEPALLGFELLSYSPNIHLENITDEDCIKEITDSQGCLEKALEWGRSGGLVTLTWHWFSPLGGYDKAFYSYKTDFDARRVLVEGTVEREAFFKDLDAMAEHLLVFKEEDIPILWRPFHEAEGDWFWWGVHGVDVARQLFRLMFDYYVNHWHLDNLIWVWNCPLKEGYVGDEYCDIITRDLYPPAHTYPSYEKEIAQLREITPDPEKLAALAEVGQLPTLTEESVKNTKMLWFMIWSRPFVMGYEFNEKEAWEAVYSSPFAITKGKLPDFSCQENQ